jgi:hypothetical protein
VEARQEILGTSPVALILAGFAVCAAALAAGFPVQLSIAAVFLFAGPHNWMEARYFAARMPVRWGQQRTFFVTAITGILALSLTFSLIAVNRSLWHSAAAIWILILLRMTRSEVFSIAVPMALSWMALAWAVPGIADLLLLFLHPLAALWFVHRQIARARPEWLTGFHKLAISIVPLAGFIVVSQRAASSAPALASFVQLSLPPSLLALHAFLELLHYGAWVILLPAIGLASAPWNLNAIPLVRHREGWPRLMRTILIGGAAAVILLWICFAIDYRTTRDVYFTLAIVHVMAEVPFLVWLR